MLRSTRRFVSVYGLCFVLVGTAGGSDAVDKLYAPPAADEVRSQTLEWVAAQQVKDERVRENIGKVWAIGEESLPARDLFEKVIETFCLADPATKKLVDACRLQDAPPLAPKSTAWGGLSALLSRKEAGEFYQANMRLFYGRYLAQRRMYDEALDALGELDPRQVVDPATCLFFRAVCQHQLLMKQDGLATIKQLLKDTQNVPVSYSTVATLMQYDLQALREMTLDEATRKMKDSGRRLDLGRGGQKVQKVQDEIVTILDEIIEKLEQQSGGGGGGGSSQNRSNQSSSPAQDSVVKGATAAGNVDRKHARNKAGWGALPPKEEARAKNLLNRNFPAHYRKAVEEYFKKLAKRRAKTRRQP